MPTSLINVLGNTVTLVQLPFTSTSMETVEWSGTVTVADVTSVFTGGTQVFQWPGADMWSGTCTLPALTQVQANKWVAALLQCQGKTNAVQLGHPLGKIPGGVVQGSPTVDGSIPVLAGGQVLYTAGWTPTKSGLLLPGDYIQVGYRYHMVLDTVNSDANGKAPVNIWPSLREVPTGGTPISTSNAVGLFRLKNNTVTWSTDVTKLVKLSFGIMEYR
ncbi:hypothetical protein [Tunturiibacter psychrotolerans]|uniref:hypothetical protein n=1 Tax=Tunturiibacter psychrotolerans TaxID=3069686 RepID=UPI003D1D75DC